MVWNFHNMILRLMEMVCNFHDMVIFSMILDFCFQSPFLFEGKKEINEVYAIGFYCINVLRRIRNFLCSFFK